MRIVVIDDNEGVAEMLCGLLGYGHEVRSYSAELDTFASDYDFAGVDCVIVDPHLDPDTWSTELAVRILERLEREFPGAYRIVFSGDTPSELLIGLADDTVLKGSLQDIEEAVGRAADQIAL